MKIYHAGPCIVQHPDTQHSRPYLDFGPGFYVTTIYEQALRYAERFVRRGKQAYLNVYELGDDLSNYQVLRFVHYDEQWLDYVMKCRAGIIPDDCDIIIGGIANDKIFRTLDL